MWVEIWDEEQMQYRYEWVVEPVLQSSKSGLRVPLILLAIGGFILLASRKRKI